MTEARRYDTRFFAAALPPGQRTRDVGGEADEVAWTRPADAIAGRPGRELLAAAAHRGHAWRAGGLRGTSAAALRAGHAMPPLIPGGGQPTGRCWLTVPEGVGYPL